MPIEYEIPPAPNSTATESDLEVCSGAYYSLIICRDVILETCRKVIYVAKDVEYFFLLHL